MYFNPKKWRKANVEAGRETASIGDTRRAEFAQLLQENRNRGAANVANIRQEGFDRRLESEQKYELPAQQAGIVKFGAETEKTKVGTAGERFFNILAEEFGRKAMEQKFGSGSNAPSKIGSKRGKRNLPPMVEGLTGTDFNPLEKMRVPGEYDEPLKNWSSTALNLPPEIMEGIFNTTPTKKPSGYLSNIFSVKEKKKKRPMYFR